MYSKMYICMIIILESNRICAERPILFQADPLQFFHALKVLINHLFQRGHKLLTQPTSTCKSPDHFQRSLVHGDHVSSIMNLRIHEAHQLLRTEPQSHHKSNRKASKYLICTSKTHTLRNVNGP
mgnify:CR=1 FL=1